VKHSFEKVGDHWEPKEGGRKGPSDEQSARPRGTSGESFGGVDANAAARTLATVCSLTRLDPLSARDAVLTDTPLRCATCRRPTAKVRPLPWKRSRKGTANPHPGHARHDRQLVSAANCWAVGDHSHVLGQPAPAIERLSGGTWSAVAAPEPTGAASGQLNGVWCASTRHCMAVGYNQVSSGGLFPFGGPPTLFLGVGEGAPGTAVLGDQAGGEPLLAMGADDLGRLLDGLVLGHAPQASEA